MAGGEVQLVDLVKRFGDFTAVAGINLQMPSGEFFSLLGPSGCGKTTTLRMIAGFERPTEGQILLDGVDMAQTPPHKRNVNTVFQNYALFPHLTVEENVAFGLRYQKASKAGDDEACRRRPRAGAADRVREAPADPALGRSATAGRPGPSADPEPRRAPAGRAARRARREAPEAPPDRAEVAAAGGRHHVHLRDARPGGGPDDVRPDRGDVAGPGGAGRTARRRSTRRRPPRTSPTSSASRT